MRLDDAVTYFLGQWPAEGPPLDTVRTYGAHLRWLVDFAGNCGKFYLADLTPDFLRTAMAAKMVPPERRRHAAHTNAEWKDGKAAANGLAYAARKLARWLLAQGVSVANLDSVRPPKPPERVQPRLRAHEFQALEDAVLKRLVAPDRRVAKVTIARDLALIYMLADTGLRAYEVCGMTTHSVDFELGAITVHGKGSKERSLSLVDASDPRSNATLHLLREWIEMRATVNGAAHHPRLWVSIKGTPLTRDQLRTILNGICREAGMAENRPPHTFRRANFTEHYRSTPASLSVLSARMGWSIKSRMAAVYTRGADIDLARETPMPSVSTRWRQPVTPTALRTFPQTNDRPRPSDLGISRETAAVPTPRRRRAHE